MAPRARLPRLSDLGSVRAAPLAALVACAALTACAPSDTAPASTSADTLAHDTLVQPAAWWSVHPRPRWAAATEVARAVQGWFDVYEVAPSTWAIYEPRQFQEAISYLVAGETWAALVDSGMGIGDIGAVVAELTDLPVRVLLTHEHFDHYGGARAFDELWTSPAPSVRARLAEGWDADRLAGQIDPASIWKRLPPGFDPDAYAIPPLEPTRLLTDGERLDLGGRTLEVIATPGHSPGSISFLDPDARLLFTGDHFYPGPLYAHAPDVNVDAYLASNDRLAARAAEYDLVMGGHNEPSVEAAVIGRVSEAFRAILSGGGTFRESDGLRRYAFDGFDVLIRAAAVEERR